MVPVSELGLFGQPMRWYVDKAEWPFVTLSLFFILGFIISYWLPVSYLEVVSPLILIAQVVAAVTTSYLTGVRSGATLAQTIVTCALVGAFAGEVAALLSFIRFFYPWLLLNLVVEPFWSGLLAGSIGAVTIGFFSLPKFIKKQQNFNN